MAHAHGLTAQDGCRSESEFARDWLESHMEEAEKRIGKPLLLQEFGKRLHTTSNEDEWQEAISNKRNPVFENVYTIVNKALQQYVF
jgi:hypothetical protein